jgi:hypothetical protein
LYSAASTQKLEELSGSATPPPTNTASTEQQGQEQIRADGVVPKPQAPSTAALGPQTATEDPKQPRPAPKRQVPKTTEVGKSTEEPTESAKPEEETEPSAPAVEEILGHYEEENRFCSTRSYTVEIPVGDEVGAVEAVGKIFLEEVKVSLA